jgi:hypothetical protein
MPVAQESGNCALDYDASRIRLGERLAGQLSYNIGGNFRPKSALSSNTTRKISS